MKLLTVVGARPQFVKAAVVSRGIPLFNKGLPEARHIQEVLVHTGQHYDDEMSAVFFRELEMPAPAYNLGVGSGPHGQQTGRMLEAIEKVLETEHPDYVLVYGDTNSTLAGALAASKLQIPIAHVEAGLRSYNRVMPEEINRVIVDRLSTLLFCPTERAVMNLRREGMIDNVHLVGDIMYDSLLYNLSRIEDDAEVLRRYGVAQKAYALATVHRAETTDRPEQLHRLFSSLGRLGLPVIVPVHPRTRGVLDKARRPFTGAHVLLIPPVSYHEMLCLERHAKLILTDSGGVQKEAFLLRVPCVTLRDETEWLETVEAGWNRLAGTDPERVLAAASGFGDHALLEPGCPYGNGRAAYAILEILSVSPTVDRCENRGS